MINITDKNLPTPYQAAEILQRHSYNCGVFFDLDRVLDYQSYLIEKARAPIKRWRTIADNNYLAVTDRTQIVQILVGQLGVPIELLHKAKADTVSIAADVIEDLLTRNTLSEEAREFLKLYQFLTKASRALSYLGQYSTLPICRRETFDNHRMVVGHPDWEVLSTGRIGASSPSVQNIDAQFKDIISYPKGYIFLRADSGQIEPRITYSAYIVNPLLKALIVLYNDAYYGMYHYITMDAADHTRYNAGETFELTTRPITEDMSSGRQILKKLALAGNYGSSNLANVDPKLGPLYEQLIVNDPSRLDWEARVKKEVSGGAVSCREHFGWEITPEDKTGKYAYGTKAWVNHLVRCFINNPIQGTASRLMDASVIFSDKLIRQESKGNTFITYYKHDEGAFYIAEEDAGMLPKLADTTQYQGVYTDKEFIVCTNGKQEVLRIPAKDTGLVAQLSDCTAYDVPGWIPIYCEAETGKIHGSPNISRV